MHEQPEDAAAGQAAAMEPEGRPAAGTVFVMGSDPLGECLILVPEEVARADALFNRTLYDTTTMGQIRRVPGVMEVVDEWMFNGGSEDDLWVDLYGAPRDELPDDFVLNPSDPFNDSGDYWDLIIAAERTQQFAPQDILDEFGRAENPLGWPSDAQVTAWLRTDQAEEIAERMRHLGYPVRPDQSLIDDYIV